MKRTLYLCCLVTPFLFAGAYTATAQYFYNYARIRGTTETVYSQSKGRFIPDTLEIRVEFHNFDDHAWTNVRVNLEYLNGPKFELAVPGDSAVRVVDSIEPLSAPAYPSIVWKVRCTEIPPEWMYTEFRITLSGLFKAPFTKRDTVSDEGYIGIRPSPQRPYYYDPTLPASLSYVASRAGYVPEEFTVACALKNYSIATAYDIRLELHCSDPQYLELVNPGDSLVRHFDSLTALTPQVAYWLLKYTAPVPRRDSIQFWFVSSCIEGQTGDRVTDTTWKMQVQLYDLPIPRTGSMRFSVPTINVTQCDGYELKVVPIEFEIANEGPYPMPVKTIVLLKPYDWIFTNGDTSIVEMNTEIPPGGTIGHTWHATPPSYPYSKQHDFTVRIYFNDWYTEEYTTSSRTGLNAPKLVFTPALPDIHVRYDRDLGEYVPSPVAFDARIAAWSGDFEPVSVKAELIYGTWMFLKFDESEAGWEAVKQLPALNMCDSMNLHWQADIIKLNELGSQYEGAIRYTVFNADSSIFKEYLQNVIIDATNQTGVEDAPAANKASLEAYPNPFTNRTHISYALKERTRYSLKLYDIMGRGVFTVIEGAEGPGTYSASVNGSALPAGVYFLRLEGPQILRTLQLLRF